MALHVFIAVVVVGLLGCAGEGGVAPPDGALDGAGRGGGPAEAEVVAGAVKGRVRWSRSSGLEVRGFALEDADLVEVNGRLAGMGLLPVRVVDPAPSVLSGANRRALVEALFPLVIAELELTPNLGANVPAAEREGLVLIRGAVVTEAEEQAMRRALERTRGLRVVTELETANPLIEPGLGQLDLRVGAEVVAPGRRELFRSTVLKDEAGRTVATDGVGRIGPGRYELADGTWVRIHPGHRTIVNPEGPVMVVGGRRYRLGWEVQKLVGPEEEGGLRVGGRTSVRGGDGELEGAVARAVIGADLAASAAEGHARLVRLGRPVHFLIDFDGTVFQTLDLAQVAKGMPADEIHIALNNMLVPDGAAHPERHPRRAEMLAFERSGPDFALVDERLVTVHGYTHAQVWALGGLLRRLVELFPRLGRGFEWEPGVLSPFEPVERVERAGDGIYLASQLDPKRRDPGPGLDLRGVMRRLAEHDEPIAPAFEGLSMAREVLERTFGVRRPGGLWADAKAELARLGGDPGHLVFRDDFHIPWFLRDELIEDATGRLLLSLLPAPGDVVFDVQSTTAERLAMGPVEGFPDGFTKVAAQLQPESEWFVWKVGDPARPELARVGHGLVRAGGGWYLLPEPWRGL